MMAQKMALSDDDQILDLPCLPLKKYITPTVQLQIWTKLDGLHRSILGADFDFDALLIAFLAYQVQLCH